MQGKVFLHPPLTPPTPRVLPHPHPPTSPELYVHKSSASDVYRRGSLIARVNPPSPTPPPIRLCGFGAQHQHVETEMKLSTWPIGMEACCRHSARLVSCTTPASSPGPRGACTLGVLPSPVPRTFPARGRGDQGDCSFTARLSEGCRVFL